MNRYKKYISASLILLLLAPLFSACTETPETVTQPEPDPVETSIITEQEPEPDFATIVYPYTNPLTGLGSTIDLSVKRPIVVSINNHRDSLPQAGIQSASIIYEVLAEGGITRLIGVFPDALSIPKIGTVRSTRPYIVDIATGYDPIFVHFGGSVDGYSRIRENKIMSIDGIAYDGIYFFRDAERVKTAGLEHSAFINAELLNRAISKLKSLDLARDASKVTPAFDFAKATVIPAGQKADTVKIKFSSYNDKSTFTYDAENKVYSKMQYGSEHIDELTGEALKVVNVFALEIPSTTIDSVGRRLMTTTGSGEGVYISQGFACSITWSRKDVYSQFEYTLDGGTPLKVNPGNSYISVVNDIDSVTFVD